MDFYKNLDLKVKHNKEARKQAKLTQEQLAVKAGTKKSYISKIENAKGNIQL